MQAWMCKTHATKDVFFDKSQSFGCVGELEKSSKSVLNGPVSLQGSRGESFQLCFVEPEILRVRFLPPKSEFLNKTWTICGPSCNSAPPQQGVSRDDILSSFSKPDTTFSVSTGSDNSKWYELETNELKVRFPASGEFYLSFYSKDSNNKNEWKKFASDLPLSAYKYEEGGRAWHTMVHSTSQYYYGHGEVSGKLNHSNRRFRLECRDAMGYDAENSDTLYKHMPMYITRDNSAGVSYGILYDHLTRGVLDMGREISAFRGSYRYYESEAGFIEYYLVLGPSIPKVVNNFGKYLYGRPAIPPLWSLGYVASTMTYTDADNAQSRLENFGVLCKKKHEIPCSGFYLSSGYTMDNQDTRNVFTWNLNRIPDPKKMFDGLHQFGINVLPNIKPWLLQEHTEFSRLEQLNGLIKDSETKSAYRQVFWKGGPGTYTTGSYIDFSSPGGFEFWKKNCIEKLLNFGADGLWNDNNEFEIDSADSLCGVTHKNDLAPIGLVGRSLQTFLMGVASWEAMREVDPHKRPLVVSRSGCLGIHRYCAQTWSGDNLTSWKTLKYNIPMCLSLGLSGWVSHGPDVGGFTGDVVSPELFVRWIQLGIYLPRFTIHSCSWKGVASNDSYDLDNTNEPWMFPEYVTDVRSLIEFRYQLMVLLHSLHIEAFLFSYPVARPLAFHYENDPNERSLNESFEFLLGSNVLVAGVFEPGADSVSVYFPGAKEKWFDIESKKVFAGGDIRDVSAPLRNRYGGIPVFVRNNSGLVLSGSKFENGVHVGRNDRNVYLCNEYDEFGDNNVELVWFEGKESEEDSIFLKITVKALGKPECMLLTHVDTELVSEQEDIPESKEKVLQKMEEICRFEQISVYGMNRPIACCPELAHSIVGESIVISTKHIL